MIVAPIWQRIPRRIAGPVTRKASGWNGKPKSRILAALGDSIVAQNTSATTGFSAHGFITAINNQSGQRLYWSHARNFGVGGDTSVLAEARMSALLATNPGVSLFHVGTNDPTGGITADQTLAAMKRMRDACKAAKVVSIFIVPAPRGNDTYPNKRLTSGQLAVAQEIRTRMLSELPGIGCYVVDNHPNLLKGGTTNDAKDNYTSDGLHPTVIGAHYWGLATAALVNTLFAAEQVTPLVENPWSAGNPNGSASSNALMAGTSGTPGTGGSGQLATSWGGQNTTGTTGITRTYSKVTKSGAEWQQVVIGGVAATQLAALDIFRQISLHTKVTPGLTYEVVADWEHDADVSNILSLQFGFQLVTPGDTTTLWDGDKYAAGKPIPSIARSGVARSPRFVMPADATDLRLRCSCYVSTDGAPVGTIRVKGFEIRPVPGQIAT